MKLFLQQLQYPQYMPTLLKFAAICASVRRKPVSRMS